MTEDTIEVPDEPLKPTVDEFLDGLDKVIGKNRPCPICGAAEWEQWPTRVALHATGILDTGDTRIGSFHVAVLVCARCKFIRNHLIAPEVREV